VLGLHKVNKRGTVNNANNW